MWTWIRLSVVVCTAVALGLVGSGCGGVELDGTVTVRPGEVEFGEVSAIPVPFHRQQVVIRNATEETVVVDRVETDDGIRTEYKRGNAVLQPNGGEATIDVILDTRVYNAGPVTGNLVVHWKGAQDPVTIPLTATITEGELGRIEGPRVRAAKRDWDFGTINRQAVVYHDFEIENIGSETLRILSVETKCGCVQGWVDQTEVAPGEKIPLHARVTASVYPGNKPEKSIYVATNDLKTIELAFFVRGHIVDGANFDPSPVEFGTITPGQGAEQTVMLTKSVPTVPVATSVEAGADFLEVERLPDVEKGDVVAAVLVKVKPDAPLGPFETRLTAVFSDEGGDFEAFTPIRGTVGEALGVRPTTVNFGLVEARRTYKRKLLIREISDPTNLQVNCEMNYLTATVVPKGNGAEVVLLYTPASGMGEIVGQVVLKDTGTDKSFRIPISAKFPGQAEGDKQIAEPS